MISLIFALNKGLHLPHYRNVTSDKREEPTQACDRKFRRKYLYKGCPGAQSEKYFG